MSTTHYSFLHSGILASVTAFFIYIYILFISIFSSIVPGIELLWIVDPLYLTIIVGSSFALLIGLYFYVYVIISTNIRLFLNRSRQLAQFVLYTAIFALLVIIISLVFRFKPFSMFLNLHMIIISLFCSLTPLIQLLHIFVNLLVIRLFNKTMDLSNLLFDHDQLVIDLNNYLHTNASVLNQCIRSNTNLGAIGISLNNRSDLVKQLDSKQLKAIYNQIDFILQEQSRNYEPWGFLQKSGIYFNFFQINQYELFNIMLTRFKSSLEQEIVVDSTKVELIFHTAIFDYNSLPKASLPNVELEYLKEKIIEIEQKLINREEM